MSPMRRFKHCRTITLISISAMLSQLPCLGVWTNSKRSHSALAFAGGKVSYNAAGVWVLRLSMTSVMRSASG